ncbi:MAG: hexose kinase [Armatimonadetes bacterium]|nr:hexose kinase [Armatimonadota bacterium]
MILCIGLTPTVQRTMRFDRFVVGSVNRAAQTIVTASGKAVNVARVLTTLGANPRLFHAVGGDSGRFVTRTLAGEGLSVETFDAGDDAPTRTCTTLLFGDGTPTTELVEESKPLSEDIVTQIYRAADAQMLHARAVACSGSLTSGAPTDFYARFVKLGRERGVRVVVDAQGEPLRAALRERPFLVKPNRDEAAATLGLTLTGNADADARTAVNALLEAGAEWALVSMGKAGSLLGGRESAKRYRFTPPAVAAVNPIGSGDSLTAGLLYALVERGESVPDAATLGTACGAANALSLTSGVLRTTDVWALLPEVTVSVS